MAWFLCTVARDSPRNWAICKEVSAWGVSTTHENFRLDRAKPGDRLLVWLAGKGYVATATVSDAMRRPTDKADAPWPGGLHRYGAVVPFRLDLELDPPLNLRFQNNRQTATGINLFQLRRGFIAIPDTAGEAAEAAMLQAAEERHRLGGRIGSAPSTSDSRSASDVEK